MSLILWNKKYTETLAVTLDRFRYEYPQYSQSKITYAGRLDPMAEGLLPLLTDDDVHRKAEFLNLDKTYIVEFMLGAATDTFDMLGMIQGTSDITVSQTDVEHQVHQLKDLTDMPYPMYSSRTVDGKALWQYARDGIVPENIPTKKILIKEVHYKNSYTLESQIFQEYITESINRVVGDFRQKDIIAGLKDFFEHNPQPVTIHRMVITATSGTYMRSLVDVIGRQLGSCATTLKITRVQVGEYTLT